MQRIVFREMFLLKLKSVASYVERGGSDYGNKAINERLAKIKVNLDS